MITANFFDSISEIEIGISGRCNSGCIDCERFYIKDQKDVFLNSRNKTLNKIIDIDLVAKHIKLCKNLKNLYIIGTTGDPFTHPDLLRFVKKIYDSLTTNIIIHTNGSLGDQNLWVNLAKFNKKTEVIFSIDGLHDTNHIYRKNLKWANIIKNAKTFIKAGGKAKWKFVVFPHNKHQIQDAYQMSKDLGFATFVSEQRYTPVEWFDSLILDQSDKPIPKQGYVPSFDDSTITKEKQNYEKMYQKFLEIGGTINPWCTSDPGRLEKFYIDADGSVWPCCYMAVLEYYCDKNVWAHWQEIKQRMVAKHGENWNNIYVNDLEKILTSDIFPPVISKNFNNLNQVNSSKILKPCVINCGKCPGVETRGRLSDHSIEFFTYRN